jgi:hypothetical protein
MDDRGLFMATPRRQIPPERKTLYYIGQVICIFGLLSFLSVFVTGCINFGNFDNFQAQAQSSMFRGFGGMFLMIIGGAMVSIATKGLAGSGVILDPEKAREDVEPWSRMAGGVVQDALSEVDVVKKMGERLEAPAPQIKVRCRRCQALNDEAAKFCNQCGAAI